MKDKEIAKRIKDLLPYWRRYKKTDSVTEVHEISMILFSNLATILEELNNE